jgi:hypothetical protein
MPNNGLCALRSEEEETIQHLLMSCVYTREVWFHVLRTARICCLCPAADATWPGWWPYSRKLILKDHHHDFGTMVLLASWSLWKECNAHVFDGMHSQAGQLATLIVEEGGQRVAAGYRSLVGFVG